MTETPTATRRRFLHHTARLAAAGALPALCAPAARAASPKPRSLAMHHTHTGERIELVYAVGARYLPDALGSLNRFLRDHYSGSVGSIDPQLLDQLHEVQQRLGSTGTVEVISGYRSPQTNERLRRTGGGGVARHSLHMDGRAIDLRLPGVPMPELRDAALSLRSGGVGFYPRERFVHLDTGRVRHW